MAKTNELYVSFESDEYKNGKTDVLQSQAELLKVMKYLENFKMFRIEEKRLKIKLRQLFEEVAICLEKLGDQLPNPSIPKNLKEKSANIKLEEDGEEHSTRYNEIDAELKEIHEKLRALGT